MAFLTAMANSFGARWFDEKWQPQFNSPEWKNDAHDLRRPDEGRRALRARARTASTRTSRCSTPASAAMWIDATVGGFLRDQSEGLEGRRQGRLRARAEHRARQERQLAVGLVARDPRRLEEDRRGREVHRLGDQQGLHRARRVARKAGPTCRRARAPRSTRTPTT